MTWTKEQENYIRKNIHLSNQELANRLGRSLASVENKVRELGLARSFQKKEIEILMSVWGSRRKIIEKALPRFTWRQISRKANTIGLPPLHEKKESVNLYSIVNAMGGSHSLANKWKQAGLKIVNDKASKMKNNILLVDIEDFWRFAVKHKDIVDLANMPEDVLGAPPPKYLKQISQAKPLEKRKKHKTLKGKHREELAKTFYETGLPTKKIAEMFGVSEDRVRHIACEYKKPEHTRDRTKVLNANIIKRMSTLYYEEGKTLQECADIIGCSRATISRGLNKLYQETAKAIKAQG